MIEFLLPVLGPLIAALPIDMPEPLPENFRTEIAEIYETQEEAIHPYRFICLTPDDQELLYATVFAEAGNQGEVGMIAVAQVILNRVLNGRWGNNVEAVISAPGQFSVWPACRKGLYTEQCRTAVDKALMAEDLALDTGVLYFSRAQVAGTKYAVTIGDHVFSR